MRSQKLETQSYHLGGYAAGQVMVNDGDSILGQVDIKLHVGSTLQEHHQELIQYLLHCFTGYFFHGTHEFILSHAHMANLQ